VSLHLLLYLVAAHSRFLVFLVVFMRLAASLATKTDDPTVSLGLPRFIRFRFTASTSCIAVRGRLCISRRLLSSYVVVGPENLTRARLRHRPSYELRAYVNQYICKLFFLCFFSRCDPHFFIITFLYLYPRLLLS